MAQKSNGNGLPDNLESKLWSAADKLRGHLDAADYKHVVLGLIFLKYISDAFQELYNQLSGDTYADPEDRDEYLAENIFFVPEVARWIQPQDNVVMWFSLNCVVWAVVRVVWVRRKEVAAL